MRPNSGVRPERSGTFRERRREGPARTHRDGRIGKVSGARLQRRSRRSRLGPSNGRVRAVRRVVDALRQARG